MPELPEVETTMRGLDKIMRGTKIAGAKVRRSDLRWPLPKNLAGQLTKRKIAGFSRRAKYMVIHLDNAQDWIVHLGMSGRMCVVDARQYKNPEKHDHVLLALSNKKHIAFNDPRRFGMMDLIPSHQTATYKLFKHLGFEPLSREFTGKALFQKLMHKKIAIKLAIMDQKLVVGVGNIYASESLYYANIDPRRKASNLTLAECAALVKSIKKVLQKAIKAGGSSLRDYVQSDGTLGNFQSHFAVYDRKGEKCPKCKTGACIQKITQGGRATYYCPINQI
ncbi:MAG: bifunctional DNA-formamidopyrimidine glycosylase/DNA-(apurinic or apyrimidinic site) lyase [Alphaproteobacteria bacterium]|nr:MAG: bifunctional DNA-formamidopyrimidine glycosylase/DNA-(apurinic or apyrimidinic site) lyase [Alphaproteobacteria bacterium]